MTYPGRECPSCKSLIFPDEVPATEKWGFPCPYCGQLLKTSLANLKLSWIMAIAILVAVSLYFGLRSPTALLLLLGSLPLSVALNGALALIFPPPFRAVASQKHAVSAQD